VLFVLLIVLSFCVKAYSVWTTPHLITSQPVQPQPFVGHQLFEQPQRVVLIYLFFFHICVQTTNLITELSSDHRSIDNFLKLRQGSIFENRKICFGLVRASSRAGTGKMNSGKGRPSNKYMYVCNVSTLICTHNLWPSQYHAQPLGISLIHNALRITTTLSIYESFSPVPVRTALVVLVRLEFKSRQSSRLLIKPELNCTPNYLSTNPTQHFTQQSRICNCNRCNPSWGDSTSLLASLGVYVYMF